MFLGQDDMPVIEADWTRLISVLEGHAEAKQKHLTFQFDNWNYEVAK